MIEQLVAEGHELIEVAAAALKLARASEKQRPVANIAEVAERPAFKSDRGFSHGDRSERGSRFERGFGSDRGERPVSRNKGRDSHEEGMIRLRLGKGKIHGVRPNDIVGTIAHHADIPGSAIGKIRIEDNFSFVDVPEVLLDKVMTHNGNYRIGKHKFALEKA
jgi:ATP-dependent RNA helicase DeaD